jgi:hypothetical protein
MADLNLTILRRRPVTAVVRAVIVRAAHVGISGMVRPFGRGGLGLWEAARGCMLKEVDFLVAYSRDRGSGHA